MAGRQAQRGFSLVETVIVIVIAGILSTVIATVITGPMQQYVDVDRRTRLVDLARLSLEQMRREIRQALPNSIRTNGTAIEFLRTLDGGRYRRRPPGDPLRFAPPGDTTFDVMGQVANLGRIVTGSGNDCLTGAADCLVIYNTGQPGANAWAGDNIATLTAAADNTAADGSDRLGFDPGLLPGNAFPLASPGQRFYVVDTPVSYLCDTTTGEIHRYQDYAITASQPVDPAAAPLNTAAAALLVNRVSACQFQYTPGTLSRSGLVTLRLSLSEAGETITLIEQIHIVNTP